MTAMDRRTFRLVFPILLSLFFIESSANDVIGCGGFIKSHVSLDFSKVEIKLFTKQGSLKEKTECAPNNGYYFLPLYEKGEYILKAEPPPGWSIEPDEIVLDVDGVNDPCSKGRDVDFTFAGFGITGRVVTAGSSSGPSGVSVSLVSQEGVTRETETKFNGDFHFTPVIPGKYTVKISHQKWKLDPHSTIVQVSGGNTALRPGSLAVRGYDVRGTVVSNGKGVPGVRIVLYSAEGTNPQFKIEGCDSSLLPETTGNPICHVVTGDSGEFNFGSVPAGEYVVVPLEKPKGPTRTLFNIDPKKAVFKVEHDSVDLKRVFEVTGFTISGTVTTNRGGKTVPGVQILLDRKPIVVTDKEGQYSIPNLKSGTFALQAVYDGCEFNEVTISISDDGIANIPQVYPARWRVCGSIRSPIENARRRSVSVQSSSSQSNLALIAHTGDDDKWCIFIEPGNYLATVQISDEDRKDGLQFYPTTQKIAVGYRPVDGIVFSQLKATLTGSIKCLKDSPASLCSDISVTLRSLSLDGSYNGQPLLTKAKDGKYSFKDVLPNVYEVSVPSESLCWSSFKHNIAISSTEAVIPDFVQTGYAVSFSMSHKSQVSYVNGPNKGTLEVPSGVSKHCLPTAGEYVFTPVGCHVYQPATATYNTKDPNKMVVINAVLHSVGIDVHSEVPVDDLKLTLESSTIESVGPLKPLLEKHGEKYVYKHTMMLAKGKAVQVTPSSKILIFSPPGSQTLSASTGDCVDIGLLFTATKGKILSGQITPPIKGVTITLHGASIESVLTTKEDGKYHFGPLDSSLTYTITAEKESYVLTGPDSNGNFHAQKLAEIVVKIVDASSNEPLQGALVSVSGGSSYRRNLVTGDNGQLSFPSLAPGEYYLKPLMKEYQFKPSHKIINVKEGETHEATLSGVRVACSGIGQVLTLSGMGLGGVTVAAEPVTEMDPSKCPTEEAVTERDTGMFRIRGLLRDCTYNLKIKAASELGITHVIPSHINLKVISQAEDIEGLRFTAVQPLLVTDVTVLVFTPNVDHYKTLKLRLATETEPTSNVFSTKLDASGYPPGINPGLMFTLPRLHVDNRTYILQLESSLSKSAHSYNIDPIYFNSDGKYKHFKINFGPKVKVSEQDLNQPSILILAFFALLAVAFFNQEKVITVGANLFGSVLDKVKTTAQQGKPGASKGNQYAFDDSQIDQIVQTINAVKKKPKPRKV